MQKQLSSPYSYRSSNTRKLNKSMIKQSSSEKSLFSSIKRPLSHHSKFIKSDEEKGGPTSMRRIFKDCENQVTNHFDYKGVKEFESFQEEFQYRAFELKLQFKVISAFTCFNLIIACLEAFLTYINEINCKDWRYSLLKFIFLLCLAIFEGVFWIKSKLVVEIFKKKFEIFLIIVCYLLNFLFVGEIFWTDSNKIDYFCLGLLTFFFSTFLSFCPIVATILQFISLIILIIKTSYEFQLENLITLLITSLIILLNFLLWQKKLIQDKNHSNENIQCSENKKFYKSFLNIFPDGLAFVGQDLELEYSNKSFTNFINSLNMNDIREKLQSLKNINYEPRKINSLRKSSSVPLMRTQIKIGETHRTLKTLVSGKELSKAHKKPTLLNLDSKKILSLKKTNTLKANFQSIRSLISFRKSKKYKKSASNKRPIAFFHSLSKKNTIKDNSFFLDPKHLRLLHTMNDENVLESIIFGKVKKVEFKMKTKHHPNIFISNHQTLYDAISTTLDNMRIYQSNNPDLSRFNSEFNSILVLKTVIENSDKSQKSIEVRIIPIFFKNEPKLILSLNDCTDLMTIELMKKTDEYKNILMSYVSHELRTPLNGMLAMIESVKEKISPEMVNQYIVPSLNCGKNLLCLINDILDFEQIRKGKMRLFEKEFCLRTCLEEILSIIKLEASKKNLELFLSIDPKVPEIIMTDPNRLRQIILNLLGNSMKFTTSGSISIEIIQYKSESSILQVSVKDTGLGIRPEDQKKLFKQFGKLDLQDKNFLNTQGVGLGLIISHSLATELGPKSKGLTNLRGLKVKSELGKGSEFYFLFENRRKSNPEDLEEENINIARNYIALKRGPEFQNKFEGVNIFTKKLNFIKPTISSCFTNSINNFSCSIISKETMMDNSKSPLRFKPNQTNLQAKTIFLKYLSKNFEKKCICADFLIVDDNCYNIMVLENFLKKLNRSFESCCNGFEAVEKVQMKAKSRCCNQYSIIFMDCEMPIMNGYTAVLEIKSLMKTKKIPDKSVIIATTAFNDEKEKKKCFQCGMDDVLIKPILFSDFQHIIQIWENKKGVKKKDFQSKSL